MRCTSARRRPDRWHRDLDAGDQAFVLRVEDGRGGKDEQHFTLTVTVAAQ
jgi:hypothetical protein